MSSDWVVRFSEEDLRVFCAASGDRNPLHLSRDYASRTAYGQQVVFGALGCIASLGGVPACKGVPKRVTVDFQRPMFLHVDYRAEHKGTHDGITIRLLDGSIPVLTTSVHFSPEERERSQMPSRSVFPLQAPRLMRWVDLWTGLEAEGEYRCDSIGLKELYRRWSLDIDPIVAEALLWSSYFVGMELPGQSALFFRVVINLYEQADPELAIRFKSKVSNLNLSIAQVRTAFDLLSGNERVASGQLTAFVRPEMPVLRLPPEQWERCGALQGKVAAVIGASRGLGAAMAMDLAAEGAQVIAASRSAADWGADLPARVLDRVTFWRGDAGVSDSLQELSEKIGLQFGRLDMLVCSAFPAIPSLRLETAAAARIRDYISRATDLVLGPLCQLLPLLNRSNGCAILISSAAVHNPVREWPHYVAAKAAAESLFHVAPLQFPGMSALIVRPERLLTEMTNTPMGRQGATSPLVVAQQICKGLQTLPTVGTCEIRDLAQGANKGPIGDGLSPAIDLEP